jgi:hypothetical protein
MGFMDILSQYVGGPATNEPSNAPQHFDQVARTAPSGLVGAGLAEAFRADATPPFGEMVAHLFDNSSPQQRAGLLNEFIGSLGPGVLGALSGPLADLLRRFGGGGSSITPEQASAVTPRQVQEVAQQAEAQNPSIVDRLGQFYAKHPDVVKTLGTAALMIALSRMARSSAG